jgi:hypothetical protein
MVSLKLVILGLKIYRAGTNSDLHRQHLQRAFLREVLRIQVF